MSTSLPQQGGHPRPGPVPDRSPTIEVEDLTVAHGATLALDAVTFSVRPGRITGFLGPNGAGKSTTFRVLTGVQRPDSGTVLVDGRALTDWPEPGRKIAAVLGHHSSHRRRTALDHLRWVGRLLDVDERRCSDVLDRVGLAGMARARTGTFSLGMHQRLGLATALLGDPEIVLLDEPMNGLDPEGIEWLTRTLEELKDEGRTIFLASHLLRETENLVDDLVIIADGRIVHSSTMDDFVSVHGRSVVVVRCADPDRLAEGVRAEGGREVSRVGSRLTLEGTDASVVSRVAREQQVDVTELTTARDLTGAYHAAVRGASGPGGEQA